MTVSIAAPAASAASHRTTTPAALDRAGLVNPAPNRDTGASSRPNTGFASTLMAQQAPALATAAPFATPATITIPAARPGKILPVANMILAAAGPGRSAVPATTSALATRGKTAKAVDKSAATSDTPTAPAVTRTPPLQGVPIQAPTILTTLVQAAQVQPAAATAAQTQKAPTPTTATSVTPTLAAQTQATPMQAAFGQDTPVTAPPFAQAGPVTASLSDTDDAPMSQTTASPVATPIPASTATDSVITSGLVSDVAGHDAPSGPASMAATPSRIAALAARAAISDDPLAFAAVPPANAVTTGATPVAVTLAASIAAPAHAAATPPTAQPAAQHTAVKSSEPVTPTSASPAAPVLYAAMATAAPATSELHAPAAAAPTQTPTDFATLVDSIARARDDNPGATAAPVGVTMQHADFGRVSMQFTARDQGLAVTMRSADPGFAPAVAAAAATTSSAGAGDAQTNTSHGQDTAHANPSDQPAADTPRQTSGATQPHAGSDQTARHGAGQNAGQNAGQRESQSGGQPRNQPRQANPASMPQSGSDAADTAAIFA